MTYLFEYPERVTLQPDGTYRWTCKVDKSYEQKNYRITMIVCTVIAVFILIFGGIISMQYPSFAGSINPMIPVAISTVAFLVISFLICLVFSRLPGDIKEIYWLTDTYIKSGSGRSGASFDFRRVKTVTVGSNWIELKGSFGGPKFFIPEGDMNLVRDYILTRIPGSANIIYQTPDKR